MLQSGSSRERGRDRKREEEREGVYFYTRVVLEVGIFGSEL
jgi:hypothetical protein